MKKQNKLTQEILESWKEFSELLSKITPDFMKKIYRNKPLFYTTITIAICIELIVAYFIYTKTFSAT